MGNMREISVAECKAVFGGTDQPEEPGTIVTAPKGYQPSTAFYDSAWALGSGGGGFGFANIADMFNSLGLEMINSETVPFIDENGDGYDDNAEIVVTAPANPLPLLLANDFATQKTIEMLALHGAALAIAGADIGAILIAAGIHPYISAGIVGALGANGVATSASELLSELRDTVQIFYRDAYLQDIEQNPDRYYNWIYVNGAPFDTRTMDD